MQDKQAVYDSIRQQIIDEKLLPGQWLIERELCTLYGMSRTPIREILWRLAADGFLEQELNRGFMIRKLSLEQIFEVFQTREAIEGMAARLACRKGNGTFRNELCAIRDELDAVDAEHDTMKAISVGRRLHNAVMEAARNGMMTEIYTKLKNLTILTSNLTKKSPVIEKLSKDAHFDIIDALLENDEEKSERVMREHLRDTCRQVVEQFYPGMLNGSSGR